MTRILATCLRRLSDRLDPPYSADVTAQHLTDKQGENSANQYEELEAEALGRRFKELSEALGKGRRHARGH